MKVVIDKLIILISCILLQFILGNNNTVVIVYIIAIIIGASQTCFDNAFFRKISTIAYLILCVFRPEFTVTIPLLAYEFGIKRVDTLFQALLFLNILINSPFKDVSYFLLIIIFFVSILLGEKTRALYNLEAKVRVIRDDSEENKRMLIKINQNLLDNQDQEIYVAKLQERNRIARDIHDNVGHMISRSILQVGALRVVTKEENLKEGLGQIKETLDLAMDNIRDSVHNLHDESVNTEKTIMEIINPLRDKMEVDFSYEIEGEIPREIKYTFISIVKEAVANIIKYSSSDLLSIDIFEHPTMFQLIIWDRLKNENKRIKFSQGSNLGIGLINMENRVDSLKGTIHFNTENGFKIFISIPKQNI